MKNRYFVRSRISEARFREIDCFFSVDLTALQAAALSGVYRNMINIICRGLRERIAQVFEVQRPMFGVVEVDESLFVAKRVKGNRGRGAYGKTTVIGIFEREGQIYT